jgi:hypothetical protein
MARQTFVLPNSVVLPGMANSSLHLVACGASSDTYRVVYSGQEVAIKVLKKSSTETDKNRKTVFDVSETETFSEKGLNLLNDALLLERCSQSAFAEIPGTS